MKKLLTLAAFAVVFAGLLAAPALAGPRSVSGTITIDSADSSATETVALASEAWEIDRIVFYNAGAATTGVTVAAADLGYYENIDATALAATGGNSIWPRRAVVSYHQSTLLDTNDTAVSAVNVSTNWAPYLVRDLRITAVKGTNLVDCAIGYRIYGRE